MARNPVSRRTFLHTGACLGAVGVLGWRRERISRLVPQLGPSAAERLGYPRKAKLIIIHADDIPDGRPGGVRRPRPGGG